MVVGDALHTPRLEYLCVPVCSDAQLELLSIPVVDSRVMLECKW